MLFRRRTLLFVSLPICIVWLAYRHYTSREQSSSSSSGEKKTKGFFNGLIGRATSGGPSSCEGHCGGWAENCWCDESCESHGNCCEDYKSVCKSPKTCPTCPNSEYNCDDWIKWDPSRYSCASLEKDFNCDCTGCTKCDQPPRSNAATLHLLDTKTYPQARCLDGSMAGYYLRRGAEPKFLIFLEGGGWCYDDQCNPPTKAGTLANCRERSGSRLGSSRRWYSVLDAQLTGALSSDPIANPVFHNWTLVYLPYCDGASFSGNQEKDGLHFRGKAILDSVIAETKKTLNIQQAQQVVLSGGSAGASAVYYHIDQVRDDLGVPPGVLYGLPDAGFFLNLPDKDGIDCWPAQMKSLFDNFVTYRDLNKKCLDKFSTEPWKCLYPEYFADLIETPVFALNSLYDSSETRYTLRLNCCPSSNCGGGEYPCSTRDLALFQSMRDKHEEAWKSLISKNNSGVWAPSCIAHTMSWDTWTNAAWSVPADSKNTMAAVVGRWLAGEDDGSHFNYQDPVPYPDNKPCSGTTFGW
mmetsp:Transcript_84949/g.177534  ORF Transcript_84949/g.177534 Transcript_84949/m.177534 type:complete len:523 (-) Transcript_84949:80-1648(-)